MDVRAHRLRQFHGFGLLLVPVLSQVLGLVRAIAFLAGIPLEFATQGRVKPPHGLPNFPKGGLLFPHGVQTIPFFLGQLCIPLYHFGPSSLSWPSILPAGQGVRRCTYYVKTRLFGQEMRLNAGPLWVSQVVFTRWEISYFSPII